MRKKELLKEIELQGELIKKLEERQEYTFLQPYDERKPEVAQELSAISQNMYLKFFLEKLYNKQCKILTVAKPMSNEELQTRRGIASGIGMVIDFFRVYERLSNEEV